MEHAWSIRSYSEGDEEGIFELDKAVHPSQEQNREKWMRWWHWMYKENPAGNSRIWLAEHDGRIVGQYPLIPMDMKVGNEIMRASQNVGLMTHPDYQHQGIFSALERVALDSAGREGVHITIGFPNEAALPGHIKSGWFDIAAIQVIFKPLNWGKALKLRINNKFLLKLCGVGGNLADKMFFRAKRPSAVEDLAISQVSSFDERVNELWTEVSNHSKIMVVRKSDYLNWRYVTAPSAEYSIYIAEQAQKVCGYLVLGCRQKSSQTKVGIIFDVIAQSEEIAQCLISKAIKQFEQEKVYLVYCLIVGGKKMLREAFKANGLRSIPFVKWGRFCAYSSSPHTPKETLRDSRNWFVQIGDSDLP